jgi:long-chain acyl-CoA synthetase
MIRRDGAQTVFLVPTHAQLMRETGVLEGAELSSLDTLYFNAAPLPQELKLWVLDALPHVGCHELYGSTEAGIVSNLRPADMRRKERCVGPPWLMTEVRLVDPDGNELGPGNTGELYSRSPYLMNGYLDDPEATAACTTDDGFLTSGDICHMDEEGYLYVVDRVKDMVISGGVNIYPREIEEVLRTHPDVRDAAVVGAPSETWGEEVVAFIVGQGDAAGLDAHCREGLAGFKVPKRFEWVDDLPRNAAGKVLKRELRDRLVDASRAGVVR